MADGAGGRKSDAIARRGLMLVLSSPSGAGKTTLSRMLLADHAVELSISVTTRPQRPAEQDGAHYHFIDRARFDAMVRDGELPTSIVWKISAVLAPSNPVSFKQLIDMGGTTVNVPSDVSLVELAEIRAASGAPIDLYLEAPDALGGMVRGNELAEIATVAAPLYAKFGLRNARMVYPAGEQNMSDVVANVREKVRRAALALEILETSNVDLILSKPGAEGIGVPEP